jgi:hypothetical protein
MSITGTKPFFKLQAGIESVLGTAVPATRIAPIVSGSLVEHGERVFIQEERQSLIKNYRSVSTKRFVEMSGIELAPTFEDLAWWFQFFLKGGVTGSGAGADKTYTFLPTADADDLKSATFEPGDLTQAFQVAGCVGTRLELTFARNAPSSGSCDFVGFEATPQAFTGALTQRETEDINGALTAVYIDDFGGTFGSSLTDNVLDIKVGFPTEYQQFWALNGSLAPVDAYRAAARSATVEMTMAFTDPAEYLEFQNNLVDDVERLVRVKIEGTTIPTTAIKKSLTLDLATVWAEAPFAEQDGLRVVQFSGETKFNSPLAGDFKAEIVCGEATLP